MQGGQLLEPGDVEGDAGERPRKRRRLGRLGEIGEGAGHGDPRLVLHEHAGARDRRGDDQLHLGDTDGARQAVEQLAGGVSAAAADAVARRQTEIGEVVAQELRLDAADGRGDGGVGVATFRRDHVLHERVAVEGGVGGVPGG